MATKAKIAAYCLWCLQEERLRAGQTRYDLQALTRELTEKQPALTDADISEGMSYLIELLIASSETDQVARRRSIAQASVSTLAKAPDPLPGRPQRPGPRARRQKSRVAAARIEVEPSP